MALEMPVMVAILVIYSHSKKALSAERELLFFFGANSPLRVNIFDNIRPPPNLAIAPSVLSNLTSFNPKN
jgi:hypothetical protein